jgi:hypothetical protein
MSEKHHVNIEVRKSGLAGQELTFFGATCSCGWIGGPLPDDDEALEDAIEHLEDTIEHLEQALVAQWTEQRITDPPMGVRLPPSALLEQLAAIDARLRALERKLEPFGTRPWNMLEQSTFDKAWDEAESLDGSPPPQAPQRPLYRPVRGDQVEAWIKEWRDHYIGSGFTVWDVLDDMLDEYRLRADLGRSLSEPLPDE